MICQRTREIRDPFLMPKHLPSAQPPSDRRVRVFHLEYQTTCSRKAKAHELIVALCGHSSWWSRTCERVARLLGCSGTDSVVVLSFVRQR